MVTYAISMQRYCVLTLSGQKENNHAIIKIQSLLGRRRPSVQGY